MRTRSQALRPPLHHQSRCSATKSAMRSVAATCGDRSREAHERFARRPRAPGFPPATRSAPIHSVAEVFGGLTPSCPVAKTSTRSETSRQQPGAPVSPMGDRDPASDSRELQTSKEPQFLLAAHVEQVAVGLRPKHRSATPPRVQAGELPVRGQRLGKRARSRGRKPSDRSALQPAACPFHHEQLAGGPAREQDHLTGLSADGDRAVKAARWPSIRISASTLPERLGDLSGAGRPTPPGTGRGCRHLLDCFVYSLVRIQPLAALLGRRRAAYRCFTGEIIGV